MSPWELLPLELWSTEGKHSGFCPGLPSVFDVKHFFFFFFLLALRPDLAVKYTAILTVYPYSYPYCLATS